MHEYSDIIARFQPISLEELDSIKNHIRLLKRHDTKFVFTQDKLGALLDHLVKLIDQHVAEFAGAMLAMDDGWRVIDFDRVGHH